VSWLNIITLQRTMLHSEIRQFLNGLFLKITFKHQLLIKKKHMWRGTPRSADKVQGLNKLPTDREQIKVSQHRVGYT